MDILTIQMMIMLIQARAVLCKWHRKSQIHLLGCLLGIRLAHQWQDVDHCAAIHLLLIRLMHQVLFTLPIQIYLMTVRVITPLDLHIPPLPNTPSSPRGNWKMEVIAIDDKHFRTLHDKKITIKISQKTPMKWIQIKKLSRKVCFRDLKTILTQIKLNNMLHQVNLSKLKKKHQGLGHCIVRIYCRFVL